MSVPKECSATKMSTKASSQSGEVTTVTIWLKEQLEDAWKRELNLKKLLKTIGEVKADSIEIQTAAMER